MSPNQEVGKYTRRSHIALFTTVFGIDTSSARTPCLFGFHKSHRVDHVGGDVEAGYTPSGIAVEVKHVLPFAEIAYEAIRECGLQFLVLVHPLLANELSIFYHQFPGAAQFIVGVGAGIIEETVPRRGGTNRLIIIRSPSGLEHLQPVWAV